MAVCGCGLQTSPSHYIPISWWSCDQVTSVSQFSISVAQTPSVSLHVMSSSHVRAWHWHQHCGQDGFNLQYPAVSNQYPDVQSRLVGQPVQTWRGKEKDYFPQSSPVPMMSWGSSSQMRWPGWCSGSAALTSPSTPASSISSLSTVPQPVYLQHSTTIKTEPTIASDVKILWIFYQTFVHIKLVQ